MKSVDEGLRNLYNKILSLHEKIDPNISRQFYTERFKSFRQPELIIEDISFMFDSLTDKVEQLVTKCPTTQYIERIERLLQKQEEYAKGQLKLQSRDSQTEQHIRVASESTRARPEDMEKVRPKLQIKKSSEFRQRQLKEKDMNLTGKRSINPKHRTTYATRFDIDKVTPRMKPGSREPGSREPSYPTSVQYTNTQTDVPQNSPFEDSSIYHHLKTQNDKLNQRSMGLREKSRRNSKILSINVIKNSMKVW